MEDLPPAPYKAWPHFKVAFGGAFGTLNLFVGAVSIARQIAVAASVGLSPVLKGILEAYIYFFHGAIDIVAAAIAWIADIDIHVPAWAHDWIVLWFVGTGAAFRIIQADSRRDMLDRRETGFLVSQAPGWLIPTLKALKGSIESVLMRLSGNEHLLWWMEACSTIVTYLATVVTWWLILIEVIVHEPKHYAHAPEIPQSRLSYRALFALQALAIVLAILGMSVLNAQTM